jgi:hypothetical protein
MMYGDDGVIVDFEVIEKVIDASDVFVLGFAHFAERLLVDARSNEQEAPLVQLVEPAGSPPERLAWLRRRRPSLGLARSVSFLAWPHSPSFLVESKVWDQLRHRVSADIDPEVRAQCDLALRQIQNLDVSASQALLRGEQCFTLWPRQEVKEGRS